METAPDIPCGGHYVGEGLKALFSRTYEDSGVYYESAITNDFDGLYYLYQVPGEDCVFYFRAGHIVVGVDKLYNGRYVNVRFVGTQEFPTGSLCGHPYFIDESGFNGDRAVEFIFKTWNGFTWSRDENNELILTNMGTRLDFGAMTPGQTLYCETSICLKVVDDENTGYEEDLDEFYIFPHAKVYYGLIDGKLKWKITPVVESFWTYTEEIKRIKGKPAVISVTKTHYPEGVLWQTFISNGRGSCKHGTFYFLFELIVERLK